MTSPQFNPYDLFNDDVELHVETMNMASEVLENCKYVDAIHFTDQFEACLSKSYSSFYF